MEMIFELSDSPQPETDDFFNDVQEALDYGPKPEKKFTVDDVNHAVAHVADLLDDAVSLFQRGSFGSAAFFAITAMEETAKAEILMYRSIKQENGSTKGRDPLLDHRKKHRIAIRVTTFMGRLPNLIGKESCKRLQNQSANGKLIKVRERSIYLHIKKGNLSSPKDAVNSERARELLLLALECADDILVGCTNKSFEYGNLFEKHIESLS